MARRHRSLALPIGLAASSVGLTIALLVAWTLIISKIRDLTEAETGSVSLLVVGIVSYAVVMIVVMVLTLFVVREVREVRRQDSFIDSVTHELKSPLASLKLALETLERPNLSADQHEQLRQMMLEDVERLTAFIDDVLVTTRLVHARSSITLGTVNILDLTTSCAAAIVRRHGIEPSEITLDIPPELVLTTDLTALDIILKNLLDNAVKYSDRPARVHVAAGPARQGLDIVVQDAGIGITPKYRKRVGERFFRVPTEAVRTRRGTGLGLFVVTSLVESLGGKLRVASEGEGKGTTVTLEFRKQLQPRPPEFAS
jgi:signal transduction histidine kinase